MKKMFLPVSRPTCLGGDEKGMGVVVGCGQGFVFVGEEEAAFVNQYEEEDGKSFAVFSPLGNGRARPPVVDESFVRLMRAITFWVNISFIMYVKIYSWYHRLWYHIQVLVSVVSEINKK